MVPRWPNVPVSRPRYREPERVAVVLDHPQVVFLREVADDVQVEWHAERVRHHDRAGPRADRLAQPLGNRAVVPQVHVDEDRHQVVLQDRAQRRGKPGRHGHDFVARLEPPIAQLRRGERRQRHQVGRRPGVHEERVRHAQVVREIRLEPVRVPVRRQEEIEAGVDEVRQLLAVEHAPGVVDEVGLGVEGSVRELLLVVLAHQGINLSLFSPPSPSFFFPSSFFAPPPQGFFCPEGFSAEAVSRRRSWG